ncbi:MAG TPA: glycosyltransferase family 2 protein [Candidatus Dormibacteraeota bacterium]|nr:glycosyltransferase family 2 protein [Candidatus Dormibacteraeota bacterium]
MNPRGPGISVVVPAFNSEASVPELVERLRPVLDAAASRYELILVDDGSSDGTWSVIEKEVEGNDWVRGVHLMRNYGQHNALLCGIRLAGNEVTVTMDDDLQHPPEEIPKLLARLTEQVDVVYGTPEREQHGLWRDVATQVTKFALQSAMGAKIARKAGAFRMFRTQLRDAFAAYDGPYVSVDVLLTWGTTRFDAIAVSHEPRRRGASNYTFRKLVVHAVNMITGFSTWPLQLASLVGFVFTVFGIVALLFVVVRYVFEGGSVPGFPFLASIIAIFAGAQLFSLGIMGEYLARMHARSMQHPTYAVGEVAESRTSRFQVSETEQMTHAVATKGRQGA